MVLRGQSMTWIKWTNALLYGLVRAGPVRPPGSVQIFRSSRWGQWVIGHLVAFSGFFHSNHISLYLSVQSTLLLSVFHYSAFFFLFEQMMLWDVIQTGACGWKFNGCPNLTEWNIKYLGIFIVATRKCNWEGSTRQQHIGERNVSCFNRKFLRPSNNKGVERN